MIAQSSLYWDKESKKYDAALKQYAKFSDLFKDPADHKRVITAMIKYDLIDPETHKWIDKGGSRKDLLCSIFRTCHEKKYFRFEKPFPIKALRVIASKTFDLSIGDRTLKGSKALSIKNPYYKWIFAPVQS